MKSAAPNICSFIAALCLTLGNFARCDDAIPLVAEGATLEKLADGFTFLEGPAAAPGGDLYFVDVRENKILRWKVKTRKLTTVTEDSCSQKLQRCVGPKSLFGYADAATVVATGASRRKVEVLPSGAAN